MCYCIAGACAAVLNNNTTPQAAALHLVPDNRNFESGHSAGACAVVLISVVQALAPWYCCSSVLAPWFYI